MDIKKLTRHLPSSARATLQTTGLSLLTLAITSLGQALIEAGTAHVRDRCAPKPHPHPDPVPPVPPTTVVDVDLPIYVYGLLDPRTTQIRYVGASINPWRRRLQHMSEARSQVATPKAAWLRELAAAGHEPELRILARTNKTDWRIVEDSLILRYPNLTNKGAEGPEEQ
jgi:hypothetical protein